jgi:hypothetical protein
LVKGFLGAVPGLTAGPSVLVFIPWAEGASVLLVVVFGSGDGVTDDFGAGVTFGVGVGEVFTDVAGAGVCDTFGAGAGVVFGSGEGDTFDDVAGAGVGDVFSEELGPGDDDTFGSGVGDTEDFTEGDEAGLGSDKTDDLLPVFGAGVVLVDDVFVDGLGAGVAETFGAGLGDTEEFGVELGEVFGAGVGDVFTAELVAGPGVELSVVVLPGSGDGEDDEVGEAFGSDV